MLHINLFKGDYYLSDYMTEHDASLPRTDTLVFLPIVNPVPKTLASTPSRPADTPVSNPSPTFTPTGPALADALAIGHAALASASNTLYSARARPTPASA